MTLGEDVAVDEGVTLSVVRGATEGVLLGVEGAMASDDDGLP